MKTAIELIEALCEYEGSDFHVNTEMVKFMNDFVEDENWGKDLFECPELLPIEVQDILTEYEENAGLYENCEILIEKLNAVGYTCDYDLSAEVFNLRKIK